MDVELVLLVSQRYFQTIQTRCYFIQAIVVTSVGFTLFFFFSSRRRHTRSLCDWSSDVCSSDLRSIDERDAKADRVREMVEFCRVEEPISTVAIDDRVHPRGALADRRHIWCVGV